MSTLLFKFDQQLDTILEDEFKKEYKSAVAIVQDHDRWLLGLAKNTHDDRNNKWCHPGGGIKRGESPEKAATREAYEETGVRCKAVGEAFSTLKHKNVAFVHCKVSSRNPELDNNQEFAALGFFTLREMRSLKLYHNVKSLIERVKRC
jgi:8-oxo-dGTP pyrophosphatase MutT (NUDIX family)